MPLKQSQMTIIGECLRAAAYGPFFPDGEFDSIFGLSKNDVAKIADDWPVCLDEKSVVDTAVHNSFNNLIGYPIKKENMEAWSKFISVRRNALIEIFDAWRNSR